MSLPIWCHHDGHGAFELFEEFNSWIDEGGSELAEDSFSPWQTIKQLREVGISQPSKAFYAGDREGYRQVLLAYRQRTLQQVLSQDELCLQYGKKDGIHWFERNEQRFNQLVNRLEQGMVVPFIGAGVSAAAGFPSWSDHLRQQARTAGIPVRTVNQLLKLGQYEQVIEQIELQHGREVFAQEILDVFGRSTLVPSLCIHLVKLFEDTLITTNYDRLLEQALDSYQHLPQQVINGVMAMTKPEPGKVTLFKMHGDIKAPKCCILGKRQYDDAYGSPKLDLTKPIPKMLRYFFQNNSLLFIGCSLSNDRTLQVFQTTKEEEGDIDFPQHFAFQQLPDNLKALTKRNSELAHLGITVIWYPKGRHDQVEALLRAAINELNYRKAEAILANSLNLGH